MSNIYELTEAPHTQYRRIGFEIKQKGRDKGRTFLTIQRVGDGKIVEISREQFNDAFREVKED